MATPNSAASRSILHYDPERIDYAVTESELQQLAEGGNIVWKDVCLTSASLFLASAPNAISQFAAQDTFHLTIGLFLNSILAGISFISAMAFGIAWKGATKSRQAVLEHIRNKPRVLILAEVREFGSTADIAAVRAVVLPEGLDS
jgi:hypothetical protein